MNNLITYQVFIGDINIPAINQLSVQENIDDMIKEYQTMFMIEVMGNDLFWPVKALIEASEVPVDPPPLPVEIENLLDGMETKEYRHIGIRRLYASFIYDHYTRKTSTATTSTGETVIKKENATNSRIIYKQVDVWNKMCEDVWPIREYLEIPYFQDMIPEDEQNTNCWCPRHRHDHFFAKKNYFNL